MTASAQANVQEAGDNLGNLDILRASAVLVVAGSHLYRYCGDAPRFSVFVVNLGVGGVLLFFVHTSLVLLLSMQRMKTKNLTASFYVRRAFRIYPLCWVCIGLVITTRLTDVDWQQIAQMGWQGILANGLLLQNVFRYPKIEMPLWSLPWEVQMYLFLPALYLLLARYNRKSVPLAMWVGATGLAIACTALHVPRAFHAAIFPPMFIGGMVAFRFLSVARVKLPSCFWPLSVITLMVTRCLVLNGTLIDTARNATVNATTCLVLGLAIPLFEEVRSRPLIYIAHQVAKYSYGIYLLHIPCLALVFGHLPTLPLALKISTFLVITGVASAITYHLVEHPLIQIGRSVAKRIESSGNSECWQRRSIAMKPRILVCAYACAADPSTKFFGGGDLMAWNLIKRLSQTHHLWVLTATQNKEAVRAALKREPACKAHFVYISLAPWLGPLLRQQGGLQFYAYLWQWRAYFVAKKLHRRIGFDTFHHLTYENDWMASIIGALLPVPYLRGPGGGAHRVPKEFRRQFPAKSRVWEYVRIGLQWLFRHDPFFLLSQERADVLLMANREALEALPVRWRKKARLLSVNGISSSELTPPEQQARNGEFAVLSAGRMVPLKGFDLALRAFARIAEMHPKARFVIVGEGPELDRLSNLRRELGVESQVRFESWMPRERLLENMRFCDAFLFASVRDGGGLVVVEALAAGKPVVCFDLGGPGLHINNACGFKIPAEHPEQAVRDMAAALEKLAADPILRARLGQAAYERAREVYDWDRVTERVTDAYDETVNCRRTGLRESQIALGKGQLANRPVV